MESFFYGRPYVPTAASFRTALETGHLALIPDDTIGTLVVAYFEEAQPTVRLFWEYWLDHHDQLIGLTQPYLRPRIPDSSVTLWPLPEGTFTLDAAWNDVRSDNRLLMKVGQVGGIARLLLNSAEVAQAQNKRLLAALRAELAVR